jgi:hypothetical protein
MRVISSSGQLLRKWLFQVFFLSRKTVVNVIQLYHVSSAYVRYVKGQVRYRCIRYRCISRLCFL